MVKKNYVFPKMRVAEIDYESLIADSYVNIGGTGDADVKGQAFGPDNDCSSNSKNIWGDPWE